MNASTGTLLLALGSAVAVTAQLPVGEPFVIHEHSDGRQSGPRIAAQHGRSFVVVWQSEGADGDGLAVRMRRFSPNGRPLTPELPVNETTEGGQWACDLAIDGAGNVVVVWVGPGREETDIFVRHFAADLTPLSRELIVNQDTSGAQFAPDVASREDGRYVVTWKSGEELEDVLVAVLDPPTLPVVPDQVVNLTPAQPSFTRGQAAGLRSDGGFVVAWQGVGTGSPPPAEIFQRRYSAAGVPLTGALQVSEAGPYGLWSFYPEIAVEDGDAYRVVWRRNENFEFDRFYSRKVTEEGGVGPIQPLAVTGAFKGASSGSASGELVVTVGNDYTGSHGYRYDREAAPIGQFAIPQDFPAATASLGATTEDLVVISELFLSPGEVDLVGQRFGSTLFADGFESGDTSEWDQTVP